MSDDQVTLLRDARKWFNDGQCCGQVDSAGICAAPACIFGEALKEFSQAADRIEKQAAEIARLRAELAAARREGMKDAAKWHEMRSMELSGKAGLARNFRQLLRQSDFHMESAAEIRAAAKEGKP